DTDLQHRPRRRQPWRGSVTLSRLAGTVKWCGLAPGIRNFRDHLFDNRLAKGVEVLCLEHEAAGPADDVIAIVFCQPAGRVGVFGIPRKRYLAQDDQTVDGDAEFKRFVSCLTDIPPRVVCAVA